MATDIEKIPPRAELDTLKPLVLDRLVKAYAERPGKHRFDRGLYLIVGRAHAPGSASWNFRYMIEGKARTMGLGSLRSLSLTNALKRADAARERMGEGGDPLEDRAAIKAEAAERKAREVTFKQCAQEYIKAHRAKWKNAKHGDQWEATLETYVYPLMGDSIVADIDAIAVQEVLRQEVQEKDGTSRPLWEARTETANRVRGRIEMILDYAKFKKLRSGDNPASWRGNLSYALGKRSKVRAVRNQPALPYRRIGEFMAELRTREGDASRVLEFVILTAARSGEARDMTWKEVNFEEKVWTVPAERMKAGREHRVPLSDRAIEMLNAFKPDNVDRDALVFPGSKAGEALSDMTLTAVIRRMNKGDEGPTWVDPRQDDRPVVPHGFRSTFRDWVSEATNFPNEAAEKALAHTIENVSEAAYRREDMLEKRREMMDAWATYCGPAPAGSNVKQFPQKSDAA